MAGEPRRPGDRPGTSIREAAMDVEEGAEILMVKPGLPCLDKVRTALSVSLGGYVGAWMDNVSRISWLETVKREGRESCVR